MENQSAKPEKPLPLPQEEQEEAQGSFSQCFKFASAQDFFILFSGLFLAFLNGAGISAFGLVIGLAVSTFDVRFTEEQVRDYAKSVTFYFFALGVAIFIGTFGSRTLLRINAQRQGFKIRRAYLQALLHKDPSFFDKVNPMEVSSQVENDCKAVVDSLDVQIESIVFTIGALACGVFTAFIRSWQISLMVLASVPLILGSVLLYQHYTIKAAEQRSEAYGRAGGMAEEALTNIRTVVSLGGEQTEVKRYDSAVKTIQEMLSRTGIYQGLSFGFGEFLFPVIVGIVFYIGSYYIENGTINPTTGNAYLAADLFTPISAISTSFAQLPVVSASLKGINFAKVKIKKIMDVVESVKVEEDTTKTKIKNFRGGITFKDVSFAYPVNPDKIVLQNLNVDIKPQMKIAFVGESGSGKSTIIQLLQKFYDPLSGTVEFDGHDVRTLDLSWLRKNVAYVGQEPVLFSMTIRQNLLLAKEDANEEELVQALKRANAYNFVMDMDQKMDTPIGGGVGAQLSGGQKQRIAIARAILKEAKILLLDEATSALDRLSEKEIQETLDKISGDRTIIIIAHRLSTIQAADRIVVLDKGKVVEVGTHEELLNKEGKYFDLQAAQAGIETKKDLPTEMAIQSKSHIKPEIKDYKHYRPEEEEEEEEDDIIEESAGFLKRKLSRSSNSAFYRNNESDKETLTWADIKRIWSFAREERKYFYWGVVGSIGNAIIAPLGHIAMSGSLNVLVHSNDPDYRDAINFYCILQLIIGVAVFICYTIELGLFAKASETFIQTLRTQMFYKFLRNEIGWHDLPQNSAGSLTTSLEVDTANVGQLTGTSLGLIIQIAFTNLLAVLIAFIACWQMALIGMLIVPTVIFVAVRLVSNDAAGGEASDLQMKRAEVIVSEVINNMKTVISLNAENKFLKEYSTTIDEFQQSRLKTRMVNGLLEGGMYLILYSDLAGMYYLGSQLYFSLNLSPMRIFLAVFGLALTAFFTTQLFFLMPDTGKALHSVKIILNQLSRKSAIDIDDKRCIYKGKIQGNIEFRNVRFTYPTRPTKIFEDLNFKIDAGRQIGFTGPSGCGKSTIIQLLLRFYDVDSGEILVEGVNIQEYDLRYLRKKIGGVFQEPILFNETIEYNLKYANPDIPDQEMIEACRKANALRFIQANAVSEKEEDDLTHSSGQSGPVDQLAGFKRVVGAKGGQLSGGQKQRIAIARAILRKPKVLLLDEATSALDTQSEAVVQDALNKVSQGLTTICIAHRISTIKEMNEIIVLKGGVVIERGNFDDLVAKKGYFYELKEGSH